MVTASTKIHRALSIVLCWATIVMTGSSATAQEEREGRRATYPPEEEQVTAPVAPVPADDHLARWLAIDNQAQLDIARFASSRVSSEEVDDYVSAMIDEYKWILRQLGTIAGVDRRRMSSIRASIKAEPPVISDRQRVRATAADEVLEKEEVWPVEETKSAARGTGQESGPTGTRARDVRRGETGGDNARTITEPLPRSARPVETSGPEGVGARGRTGVTGTTGDELRARDRRLDAFDRVGKSPVTESNRRDEETSTETRTTVETTVTVQPDFLQVLEEIGIQRMELVKRELGRSRGDSFDMAFLQHQVAAHMQALSLIRGMRSQAGSEFKELLDQLENSNWSNLSRAKELLYEYESAPSRVAR